MEFNERRIIKTRKKSLVENTVDNAGLRAQLQSQGLLDKFEISKLEAVQKEGGTTAEAEYIYNLVVTKSGAFSILKDILRTCNQTGAAKILDEKMKPFIYNYKESQTMFFGRGKELMQLSKRISRPKDNTVFSYITCVVGMGGIGKTELCKQYCFSQANIDENVSIFWINAELNLADSFRKIAQDMDLLEDSVNYSDRDINSIIPKIYQRLCGINYIFVLDNIESFEKMQIRQYLPEKTNVLNDNTRFILTSRCHEKDLEYHGGLFVLDKMSFDDASKWVTDILTEIQEPNNSDFNQDEIRLLMQKLDLLPLALQQTMTYIKEKNRLRKYAISDFLDDLEERPSNILDASGFLSATYNITTLHTFDFSLNLVKNDSKYGEQAYDILTKCTYFNPDRIEISLFNNDQGVLDKKTRKALLLLEQFSLLSCASPGIFAIHRILQIVMRCKVSSTKKEQEILQFLLQKCASDVDHAVYIWKFVAKHKEIVKQEYGKHLYGIRKMSPLHLLAEHGDKKSFRKIVSVLKDHFNRESFPGFLNEKDKCSRTPAYFAASHGHCKILKVIKKFGGNFKTPSSVCYAMVERMKYISYALTEWTPMHIAVYNNMDKAVLYLNNLKGLSLAHVQNNNRRKETPLVIAAKFGKVKLVQTITEDMVYVICALVSSATTKADIEKLRKYLEEIPKQNLKNLLNAGMNDSYMTPMYIASWASAPVAVFDLLSTFGANLEFGNLAQIYHLTVRNDNLMNFQWLCNENKKNYIDNLGMSRDWTPLHEASKSNSFKILKYIIEGTHDDLPELNFDINTSDYKGDTPLYQAAYYGNLEVVKYLVEKNANINSANRWGSTPIIAASLSGKFDVVEFLAKQEDIIFQPCLIEEAKESLLGMLNLHCAHAAIVHEKIDMISTLIDYIVNKENTAREEMFCENPGKITLLHVAAFFDCTRSIEYLKRTYDFMEDSPRGSIYDFLATCYLTITKGAFGDTEGVKKYAGILLRIMGLFPKNWFQVTPYTLAKLLSNDQCMALLEEDENPPSFLERIIYSKVAPAIKRYQVKLKDYISTQKNSNIPAGKEASDIVVKGFLGDYLSY